MKDHILLAGGIQIHVPKEGLEKDVNIPSTVVDGTYEGSAIDVWNVVSAVNGYLWFLIGFVCFVFLVYNGIQLVMSRGEEKEFKSAKQMMLGATIGIAICFLSYSLVRIVVNLL